MIEGNIEQRELDEIKARYGIGGRSAGPGRFPIVLVKPSHYDSDGYVIQWWRPAPSSDSLAELHNLFQRLKERQVLGAEVQIEVRAMEEQSTRIRTDRLARELKDGKGLVLLVGVQPNQFPRAMDLALPLRVAGVNVCMGGFHISRSLSTGEGATAELQEAMNLGVSLYAGEVEEERMERVLRDAWRGELKPLYNYLGEAITTDAPAPILPASPLRGTIGALDKAEEGRPLQCSFSTMVVVPGQEPRVRSADEVEQLILEHVAQGTKRFFIADDNLAENPDWEGIFDRLIAQREREKRNFVLTVQVDARCDRRARFIEKAGRAGVRRVFMPLERLPRGDGEGAHLAECQRMLMEWKRAGVMVFAGYVYGYPGDSRESVLRDIRTIQGELAVDLLEPYFLAALPGAARAPEEDAAGARMTAEEGEPLCREAGREYYSPEHMEMVLRRAAGTGIDLEELMGLLLWFHFCVVYEKVDPLQGGWLRRKHRTDRQSMMAKEKFLRFYWRYGTELAYKQAKRVEVSRRLRDFARRLGR